MLEKALKSMGLTGHEAQVYISTVHKPEQTGYEIANNIGIARANVYAALSSLLDKGFIHKVNESPAKYVAISPEELSQKVKNSIDKAGRVLTEKLTVQEFNEDVVISLNGEKNILDKVIYLIESALSTVYIDASAGDLNILSPYLSDAKERGIKVVVISLGTFSLSGALVYENNTPGTWIVSEGRPIRIITDSSLMLNGELGRDRFSRGICSKNKTLVMMAKHSFTAEIILAEIRTVFEEELVRKFGQEFDSIRQKVANTQGKGGQDEL